MKEVDTLQQRLSQEPVSVWQRDAAVISHTLSTELTALQQLQTQLENPQSTLARAVTGALDAMEQLQGRVIVTGMGKSGHIGRKIAASLASTGTPAYFVHPAEASHGDLGMITSQDLVLAISNSGESKELIDILNYCKRYRIQLIAITQRADSTLAQHSDILLLLPECGEAGSLGIVPTTSTTMTLVLGDVLTICLIERRGFTREDFNAMHPGGKLGAVLCHVRDLMHHGAEMPLLPQESRMQEVILEMSAKRLGCVGLLDDHGRLVGMITDGDLRRCFSAQVLNQPAMQLMTRQPKTVAPELMAYELLNFMNQWKITNIFVVEAQRPVGIVHIHDLLSRGIT